MVKHWGIDFFFFLPLLLIYFHLHKLSILKSLSVSRWKPGRWILQGWSSQEPGANRSAVLSFQGMDFPVLKIKKRKKKISYWWNVEKLHYSHWPAGATNVVVKRNRNGCQCKKKWAQFIIVKKKRICVWLQFDWQAIIECYMSCLANGQSLLSCERCSLIKIISHSGCQNLFNLICANLLDNNGYISPSIIRYTCKIH